MFFIWLAELWLESVKFLVESEKFSKKKKEFAMCWHVLFNSMLSCTLKSGPSYQEKNEEEHICLENHLNAYFLLSKSGS